MTLPKSSPSSKQKFGAASRPRSSTRIDPFVVVDAADLVEVCRFLRDDPRLRSTCSTASAASIISSPTRRKCQGRLRAAPGSRLSLAELHAQASLRREGDPAALEGRQGRRIAGSAVGDAALGDRPTGTSAKSTICAASTSPAIPTCTRILLSEDWVGHPLRKDYEFPLEYHGIRGR